MRPVRTSQFSARAGFSLIEIILAAVLSSLIMAGAMSMIFTQTRTLQQLDERTQQMDLARSANDLASGEIAHLTRESAIAAAADSFAFKLPISWGVVCGEIGKQKKPKGKLKKGPQPTTETIAIYLEPLPRSLGAPNPQGFGLSADGITWTFFPVSDWSALGIQASSTAVEPCLDEDAATGDFRIFPGMSARIGYVPAERTLMLTYINASYSLRPDNQGVGGISLFRTTAAGRERLGGPFSSQAGFRYRLSDRSEAATVSAADLDKIEWVRISLPSVARDSRFTSEALVTQPWIPLYNSRKW